MDSQENNKILMESEDGEQFEVEVLFSYEDEETETVYVFLVDYSDDSIIIGTMADDNSITILGPDTSDEIKDRLEKVYEDFVAQTAAKEEN